MALSDVRRVPRLPAWDRDIPVDAQLEQIRVYLAMMARELVDVHNNVPSSGGSVFVPTGTGFFHVTAGVEDAASKLVDTADVNNQAITYAKIQNVSASPRLLGRQSSGAGSIEELTVSMGPYATGSFTIPTGCYTVMADHITLTGSQAVTVQGTGTLRIV